MKELDIHPYVKNAWQSLCPDAFNVVKELDDTELIYRLSAEESKPDNFTRIVDLLMKLHDVTFIKVANREGQRIAQEHGWDHIPIGSIEARTQSDLGVAKPLMVGPTSMGAICTIIHPDVGIALSHQDIFNEEIKRRFAKAILNKGGNENGLVPALVGTDQVDINALLTPFDAIGIVKRTVREATQSFGKMFEALGVTNLERSPEIIVCGLPWWRTDSERFAQIVSNDLASLSKGKDIGMQAILSVETGTDSQIIVYGGSTHSQFSSPKRFTIK